jgi:hypothetical protein
MIYLYTNKRVQDCYNIATIIITTQIVKSGPNYSRSPNMSPDSKSMSILSIDGRSLVLLRDTWVKRCLDGYDASSVNAFLLCTIPVH